MAAMSVSGPDLQRPLVTSSKFEYQWSDHGSQLRGVLNHMFYSGSLVDVTIACPEGSIRAHQTVLAAFSPYFQSLFASHPCKHPVVFLHGAQLSVVKALVDFVYQGTVTCSVVDVPGILELARSLQIRGLDQVQAPLPVGVAVGERHPCGRSQQTALLANGEPGSAALVSPRSQPLSSALAPATRAGSHSDASDWKPTDEFNVVRSPASPHLIQSSAIPTHHGPVSNPSAKPSDDEPDLPTTEEEPVPLNLSPNRETDRQINSSRAVVTKKRIPLKHVPRDALPVALPPLPSPSDKKAPKANGRKGGLVAGKVVRTAASSAKKPLSEVVTFVCLEEEGKSRYNAMYNKKARDLGLKSGWTLLEDRVRRTLRGNSKDRSKGILEKSRMILKFRIPEDLIKLSENGLYDYYIPETGARGNIHNPEFSAACQILTLKALVRQTQFALKEEQMNFIKEGNMAAASCYGRRAVTESLHLLATLPLKKDEQGLPIGFEQPNKNLDLEEPVKAAAECPGSANSAQSRKRASVRSRSASPSRSESVDVTMISKHSIKRLRVKDSPSSAPNGSGGLSTPN